MSNGCVLAIQQRRNPACIATGQRPIPRGRRSLFGRHVDHDSSYKPGSTSDDAWRLSHVGFRSDWDASTHDALTVQGDAYRADTGQFASIIASLGRSEQPRDLESHQSGGNVLARWQHTLSRGGDLQLRGYYDRTRRADPSFRDNLATADIDFQHRLAPTRGHELLWGLNYRHTDNENIGKGVFDLDPNSSLDTVFSAFVQDQISLATALQLTLGAKFEHNDFSVSNSSPTFGSPGGSRRGRCYGAPFPGRYGSRRVWSAI